MNAPYQGYNSGQIYEIVLNLIQKYNDSGMSPTYRMMEHFGNDCRNYTGKVKLLLASILYELPKDRDNAGVILSMCCKYSWKLYKSKRTYHRDIAILEELCIVKRTSRRIGLIVVNPEYIPWFTEADCRFINDYILPTARRSIVARSVANLPYGD